MPRAKVIKHIIEPGKKPKAKPRGNHDHEAFKAAQWKKGQSGNPLGKPKGCGAKKISEAYVGALSQEADDDVKERLGFSKDTRLTYADAIALQTVRQALQPHLQLIHSGSVVELRETTEGKTPDKQEFGGLNGAPLAGIPTFAVNFAEPPAREGVVNVESYPDEKRPHGFVPPVAAPVAAEPESTPSKPQETSLFEVVEYQEEDQ